MGYYFRLLALLTFKVIVLCPPDLASLSKDDISVLKKARDYPLPVYKPFDLLRSVVKKQEWPSDLSEFVNNKPFEWLKAQQEIKTEDIPAEIVEVPAPMNIDTPLPTTVLDFEDDFVPLQTEFARLLENLKMHSKDKQTQMKDKQQTLDLKEKELLAKEKKLEVQSKQLEVGLQELAKERSQLEQKRKEEERQITADRKNLKEERAKFDLEKKQFEAFKEEQITKLKKPEQVVAVVIVFFMANLYVVQISNRCESRQSSNRMLQATICRTHCQMSW
jgi:hypothetical protein